MIFDSFSIVIFLIHRSDMPFLHSENIMCVTIAKPFNIIVIKLRVPSSQLGKNSLTFPDFFMRLFPDFPWLRGTYFTLKCRVQRGEKILANIWFEEKVHLNQGWNLVRLSHSKIPQFSLTLNKIPQDFPEGNFFPNSLWCWEPWHLNYNDILKLNLNKQYPLAYSRG